jgi:hypothetical protein
MRAVAKPEYWCCDAGDEPVAVLDIPGTLGRQRIFDVDVTLVVSVPTESEGPWHELRVDIDGVRQWSRRIASHSPGQTDGLDYHCRRVLEPGQPLRILAIASSQGSRVRQLLIEAREEA